MNMKDPTKRAYREGCLGRLREMKRQGCDQVPFAGRHLVISQGTFSPRFFNDGRFFAETIPVQEGDNFLDIGCGSGIVSVGAALKRAKRVAFTDIFAKPVADTSSNLERYKEAGLFKSDISWQGFVGDVYSGLPITEEGNFDIIFWNVPFGYTTRPVSDEHRCIWDQHYNGIRKFVEQGRDYLKQDLKPHGGLIIGFSREIGRLDLLQGIVEENGYSFESIARSIPHYENPAGPTSFELFRARPMEARR